MTKYRHHLSCNYYAAVACIAILYELQGIIDSRLIADQEDKEKKKMMIFPGNICPKSGECNTYNTSTDFDTIIK